SVHHLPLHSFPTRRSSDLILFRKDRYVLQRGVLEFPPDTGFEPIVNIQAESEIAGYQVFVNLSGPLKDSEQLIATVRSSPALPRSEEHTSELQSQSNLVCR